MPIPLVQGLFLASFLICTPAVRAPAIKPQQASLPLASEFTLSSKNTKSTYKILVSQPVKPPPPSGYPVIFVLDGDLTFGTAASQALLATFEGKAPILVVGIGIGKPTVSRDGKPNARDFVSSRRARSGAAALPGRRTSSDEADAFRRFLLDELRPAIAERAPVNPSDQALMGYSLSGLYVLDTLSKEPQAFQDYIVGNPALQHNREAVGRDLKQLATNLGSATTRPNVLITTGDISCSRKHAKSCSASDRATGTEIGMLYNGLRADSYLDKRVSLVRFPETDFVAGLSSTVSRAVNSFILHQTEATSAGKDISAANTKPNPPSQVH